MVKIMVRPNKGAPPVKDKKRKPGSTRPRWGLRLFLTAIALLLALTITSAIGIAQLDISTLKNPMPLPSFIYDRNGEKVSQLSSSKIIPVSLEQIPLHLRQAVVAVEDRRFYEHPGVDVLSIARALARDLKSQSWAEGGSTITQQLAKNMFLTSDKSLGRKLKEAGYALKIDLLHDKDEILELYLNNIYFGEGSWGVQGAAKKYFGKDAAELTLEESALLAGLPKAPTHYSPFQHTEKALERRNTVLALMKEQQYITEEEYQAAVTQPIVLAPAEEELKGKYPSYRDYVVQEAIGRYGFTEEEILTGGLQIYTELDPIVQEAVEEVYREDSFFPAGKEDQLLQSAIVLLDHTSGGVRGLMGHRGPGVFRGFNRATQLKRQPGSAFKPIVVYGPALEKGYTPYSYLYDGELNINGYQPQNWDHRYRGQVSLTDAVTNSWNIPAVWLLNEIGIDTGLDYARSMGLPLSEQDRHLSVALGGLSEGVSPLQMAQAFGTFANQGVMNEAHAITKITTQEGRVLAEANPLSRQVTSPEHAYTMTRLLENAVRYGTGTQARLNRPTAGKTGTTQLPDTEEFAGISGAVSKDAWFVGYTPELTAAVWLGYDLTDRNHYLETSGSAAPAALFREIMSRSLQGVAVVPFEAPPSYREDKWPVEPGGKPGKGKEKNNESKNKKDKGKKSEKEKEKEKKKKKEKD
ncbi:transglycosylase domain-containing protein [Paenibacillus sp. J2TS4]|uniref:transglycosylase domain-containing protein n=1 Tax=Paenibacillus sp. J2TS4 TaxID=2807194 RepID=UPI001B283DFF|nr:PBP1A family penicillin-binding protein [Paenibacillus sp. J2TS4]GIP35686.1 penicillin-binding protein [Paenibacillus sp. J2TS4]